VNRPAEPTLVAVPLLGGFTPGAAPTSLGADAGTVGAAGAVVDVTKGFESGPPLADDVSNAKEPYLSSSCWLMFSLAESDLSGPLLLAPKIQLDTEPLQLVPLHVSISGPYVCS